MTIKTAIFLILTGVIFTSCNILLKNDSSQQVKIEKTTDHNWIYGKTFIQEGFADKNLELGGSAFLRFETNEVIELKTGDIVERVTAKIVGDTIIISSEMTTSKFTFEILDNYCLRDEYGKNWIADMNSQNMTNIDFTIAKNYFVNNTVTKLENPKIETVEKFNEIFGMATTMGTAGKPTEIDFSKEYVIGVILPETDVSTTIYPMSLLKNTKHEITLNYKSVIGEKQSFTTRPNFIIIVDKRENGTITLNKIKTAPSKSHLR